MITSEDDASDEAKVGIADNSEVEVALGSNDVVVEVTMEDDGV